MFQYAKQLRTKMNTAPQQATASNLLSYHGKIIFPGVNKRKEICGGSACLSNTRIPVWLVIERLQAKYSISHILAEYPSLTIADIASAKFYYEFNQDEINAEIREDAADDGR